MSAIGSYDRATINEISLLSAMIVYPATTTRRHQREDRQTMPDRNTGMRPAQAAQAAKGALSVGHLQGLATDRVRRALAERDIGIVNLVVPLGG